MKRFIRAVALAASLAIGSAPTLAAETGLGVTPGSGQALGGVLDALGYYVLFHQICSGASGATPSCATVTGGNLNIVVDSTTAAALASIVTNTGVNIPAPFTPGVAYASLAAGASSANVALPTGVTVLVENMGSNPACFKLGTSNAVAATSSGAVCTSSDFIPGNQSVSYTVGSNTYGAAIDTSAGTTNLMLSGGSGAFAGGGGGGGGGGSSSITTWAGGTLGAMSNYGSSPGAVLVPGVNANVTNFPSSQTVNGTVSVSGLGSPFQAGGSIGNTSFGATQSGTWTNRVVGNAGGVFDQSTGSAVPANGLYVGMNVAGNLTGLTGSANGLKVDGSAVTQPVSGTVTAATSGALGNPSITIPLSNGTAAYALGQLVCGVSGGGASTAANCNTQLAAQYFTIPNTAGGFSAPRFRVYVNDTLATSWNGAQIQLDTWTAAVTVSTTASGTYTVGGDRLAFASSAATGSAGHIASYSCTFSAFFGDGFYAECANLVGNAPAAKLASGTSVFVTVMDLTATGTTTASKTMIVVAEAWN